MAGKNIFTRISLMKKGRGTPFDKGTTNKENWPTFNARKRSG